jgi:hypothetical protein
MACVTFCVTAVEHRGPSTPCGTGAVEASAAGFFTSIWEQKQTKETKISVGLELGHF